MRLPASVRSCVVLLAVAATEAPSVSDACTPGLRPFSETGDDPASPLFTWDERVADWFIDELGIERHDEEIIPDGDAFDSEPGGLNEEDFDSAYRRLLNALFLMRATPRSQISLTPTGPSLDLGPTGFWDRRAADRISSIEPVVDCGINGEATPGISVLDGQIDVNLERDLLMHHNVVQRASTLVHEAWHIEEIHRCNSDCADVCPGGGSCESSWTSGDGDDHGSTTEQVNFIAGASWLDNVLPPRTLAEARQFANYKLNNHFRNHPGFLLSDISGPHDRAGQFEPIGWDARSEDGQLEGTFQPDPDAPLQAITGIGLTERGGRVHAMKICQRPVYDHAALGPSSCFAGLRAGVQSQVFVDLTRAESGGAAANLVVTGLRTRDDGGRASHLCLYARPLRSDGTLGSESVHCAGAVAPASWETDFRVPDGQFLTGVGLEARNSGRIREWAYQARHPFGSNFAGGPGGRPASLSCGAGQVAVGVTANTTPDGLFVGQLGLLCGPRATVESGVAVPAASVTVIHGNVGDAALASTRAGRQTLAAWRSAMPAGAREVYCQAGHALSALSTSSGTYIDRVNSIGCVSLTWPNLVAESSVNVRVGGAGGRPAYLSCGLRPVTGLFIRSAAWTDGAALQCSPDFTPTSAAWTAAAGGTAAPAHTLPCMPGHVAVGTIQNRVGGLVGQFGLLCAPRGMVEAGQALAWNNESVVFGSVNDAPYAYVGEPSRPAGRSFLQRYRDERRPAGIQEVVCPARTVLAGVRVHTGSMLDRVDALICKGTDGAFVERVVGVGGAGGAVRELRCPTGVSDGLFVRSDRSAHQIALHCTAR